MMNGLEILETFPFSRVEWQKLLVIFIVRCMYKVEITFIEFSYRNFDYEYFVSFSKSEPRVTSSCDFVFETFILIVNSLGSAVGSASVS